MILPALTELQAYQNSEVIAAYGYQQQNLTSVQVEELFRDLMGWMWLTVHRKSLNKPTWLFGPLLPLDDLWHCFILHTRSYHAFCENFFGDYFHHDPEEHGQEHHLDLEELADFLKDCFLYLGEDWVDRHFAQFYTSGEWA